MSETRKAVLLIVEGPSDKIAFAVLSTYNDIRNNLNPLKPKIMIIPTGGDKITYEYKDFDGRKYPYMKGDCLNLIAREIDESLEYEIEKRIKHKIEKRIEHELTEDCLNLSDIEKVFLVTDMDGVYIDDQNVRKRPPDDPFAEGDHPTYTEKEILADNPYSTRDRNKRKRINIEYMLKQPDIVLTVGKDKASIPFGIFYMSCNLDHVTCGRRMVRGKCDLADKWACKISSSPNADKKIEKFFRDAVPENLKTYRETWEYMCAPNTLRSLSRASNCLFILNELDNIAANNTEVKK